MSYSVGMIRYATQSAFERRSTRIRRQRIFVYSVSLLCVVVAFGASAVL
jgi:hypothetical protein